ncbi:MAG TPA: hypothetical protein VM308_09730 [Sphingomicrobium sp.]|nr:hypothetical protein [Sphingomicrobium sp.]
MSERIASAVFDRREEAGRALSELRSAGVSDNSISIIGRHGEQSDTTGGIDDEDAADKAGDAAKGAAGGAVAGGLLGVAALAIPGVGPLAAAGAIASGAIPGAAAIGAGAGALAGGLTGLLTGHGISDEDARYYEDRIKAGGYFLSVETDNSGPSPDTVREILFRNGGHNASRQRTTAETF